jgi:hypothetical protein
MQTDKQKYTTGRVLSILMELEPGARVGAKEHREQARRKIHDRLRAWHSRGVLEDRGHCAGPGAEREYGFEDVVFMAALVYATQRVANLDNAHQIAMELQGYMAAGYREGFLMLSNENWVELKPIELTTTAKTIGINYTWRAPVVVFPAQLFAGIIEAIEKAAA